jgi:branched-subunit amino acid permease
MTALSTIEEIVRDLLIFVVVLTALLIGLIVVVANMPADNPLKRLLTALCYRLGATAAAGAVAIPVEPIPGLDALYDVAVPVLLLLYWISFFKNAGRLMSNPSAHAHRRVTDQR